VKGKFITIEGTEGVGKSTNLEFVRSYLEQKGIDIFVTREPGGTPLAEELREVLLEKRSESFDPTAELLTVFAARAQHLNTRIKPALEQGRWVLSDRFTDATFAYQGFGRELGVEIIEQLENLVQQDLRPDLTLLLDIDVHVGLQRARARAELDRFESEQIEFFERVRRGYHYRVAQRPEHYAVVDASQTLVDVQKDLAVVLDKLLGNCQS